MITKIRTAEDYKKVMQLIEGFLGKATKGGGFHSLSDTETKELKRLSLLAETWEDNILPMSFRQYGKHDFFQSAGLFAHRKTSARQLRKKAWRIKK